MPHFIGIRTSFVVDPNKGLFYCYGCGRGGDVIRFVELYHQVRFSQALAVLLQWRAAGPLLQEVARFYRVQLHRHGEAIAYLYQRGIRSPQLVERMQVGYAPGGCLRSWLTQLGHGLPALRQVGLVTGAGYDTYVHRVVFPLEGNLYGRSLSASAPAHRFLPGAKGGLYSWAQARAFPEVILVEGLSTMRCFGRLDFTTSLARWGPNSMGVSSSSCVKVPEPSIWPLMQTPTAAAGKQRSASLDVSGKEASPPAWSHCPRTTIQTASSSPVATLNRSTACCRRLREISSRSTTWSE